MEVFATDDQCETYTVSLGCWRYGKAMDQSIWLSICSTQNHLLPSCNTIPCFVTLCK